MTFDWLEYALTRGHATWFNSVVWDGLQKILHIELISNPDDPRPDRTVRFSGVKQFTIEWHTSDSGALEGLIGVSEEKNANVSAFHFFTDQRHICFLADCCVMSQ